MSDVILIRICEINHLSFCLILIVFLFLIFFFFNAPATTEIYTLSLHDALPISPSSGARSGRRASTPCTSLGTSSSPSPRDRKSTRLNSSHGYISYAVFCLKKKKKPNKHQQTRKPHPITLHAQTPPECVSVRVIH